MVNKEGWQSFRQFAFDYMEAVGDGMVGIHIPSLERATEAIRACPGTVWLIGNGGSGALASHMATDLQLANVKAIALTDPAALTTWTNDVGFESVFICQLSRLAYPGDVLITISGSGNSNNLLVTCNWAREAGLFVIGMSGFDGGQMRQSQFHDVHLHAPANHMGQAQDLEQMMLHIICYWLMQK